MMKILFILCQCPHCKDHCQGTSNFCILIGLQPLEFLLKYADSLQQFLPVLLAPELCLLLHLCNLPLVPALQLSRHRLKETLSYLMGNNTLQVS